MKIKFVLLFLISVIVISCSAQNKFEQEMVLVLQEYREAKSNDYSLNGGLWGGETVEAFRHEEFDAIASNISNDIFILQNKYEDKAITQDKEYERLSGVKKVFEIMGNEIIIGKIENNQAIYYKEPVVQRAPYLMAVQEAKLLLIFDFMYTARYVLEKDVPALLERLKRTGDEF